MAGVKLIGTGQTVARLTVTLCGLFQAGVGWPQHGARRQGAPAPPGHRRRVRPLEYLTIIRRTMR